MASVAVVWWLSEELLKEMPLHRLAKDERLGSWGSLLCRQLRTRAQSSQYLLAPAVLLQYYLLQEKLCRIARTAPQISSY